jgi:uncharacterized phage protein gp47/JayE
LETATEEALDAQGSNWLVSRLPAVAATGTIAITRESSSGALVIPAGWGQLTVPPAAPGVEGVAVITLENAEMAEGTTTVTVTAQAVQGGTAGNLSTKTKLTPISPIIGVNSQEGYEVGTAFTGGVNQETDEAYRKRIPLVVQGRVKGTTVAYEAAVLSVPGVESVGVLKAGTVRSSLTEVPAGDVEVVYQGGAGLLMAVESAVEGASTLNQHTITNAAISLTEPRGLQRIRFSATIYYAPGINSTTLKTEVESTAIEYINKTGLGNTLYLSGLVEAIHQLPNVTSIGLPLTRLAVYPATGATDITTYPDQYTHLAESDVTLTMNEV